MLDTLLSFVLGILSGVGITLLFIRAKNKRQVTTTPETAEPSASSDVAPVAEEALQAGHAALKPLAHNTEYFENDGNGRATLTGFEVLEVEQNTQQPAQLAETSVTEEVAHIENAPRRDAHLENEWIEAERIEAERLEAELIETVRLEADILAAEEIEANRIEIDRIETERIEAERIEAERIDAERVEAERIEAERIEAERVEADRVEAERVEAEQIEAERVEAERIETERLEQEFATLQAAEHAAEEAAKEIARLDVEQAQKRAAEESMRLATEQAAAREQQRLQEEHERISAEKEAEQAAQRQADQLAAEAAAQLAASAATPAASVPVSTAQKIKKSPADILIMVADDSKVVRVKTSRVLTKNAYQVTLAEDGNDAASQIDFIMPDLLITDVEMPGMDGFALTRHLRANPITAHLPIIMISGASDELVDKAKQAGIDVLLGKPYSDEDLIGHIRRLVQGE
ncbi:MAG: response regulator [Undibacterium sp.]|nr:response regulator [Undibacterium sp.]